MPICPGNEQLCLDNPRRSSAREAFGQERAPRFRGSQKRSFSTGRIMFGANDPDEATDRGVAYGRVAADNTDLLGYAALTTVRIRRARRTNGFASACYSAHPSGGNRYSVPMPRSSPMRSAALSPKPVNTTTVS
jgi:hypothetical protein